MYSLCLFLLSNQIESFTAVVAVCRIYSKIDLGDSWLHEKTIVWAKHRGSRSMVEEDRQVAELSCKPAAQ